MNRQIIILIFILALCQSNVVASVNFYQERVGNDFKLGYHSWGGEGSDYGDQVGMLFSILEEFNSKVFRDTAFFFIELNRNDDRAVYELSYETIDFNDYYNVRGQHKGIKLLFEGTDLIYSDLLKVLYFSLSNQQLIISLQKASLNDSLYWYPFVLKPMINARLQQVISKDNPIVSEVLNKRFYRVLTRHRERNDSVDYYYQNNQFHIYKTKGPNPMKAIDTSGKTLGSFEKILSIISDSENHYLIFVNNFCFYHLTLNNEKISGPFCTPESFIPYWNLNLVSENNIIRIPHQYQWGDFMFDFTNGTVTIDSNSIRPNILEGMRREANNKIKTLKEKLQWQIDLRQRRVNGLIIILAALLLNIYLAKLKK